MWMNLPETLSPYKAGYYCAVHLVSFSKNWDLGVSLMNTTGNRINCPRLRKYGIAATAAAT